MQISANLKAEFPALMQAIETLHMENDTTKLQQRITKISDDFKNSSSTLQAADPSEIKFTYAGIKGVGFYKDGETRC